VIGASLQKGQKAAAEQAAAAGAPGQATQLYFVYDQRDTDDVTAWADFLFKEQFEVIHPVFDGDEADVRSYHEENLRICDGVFIFYGAANETWLRRKLREIQKSAGYGRTKPAPVVGICLVAPKTREKERFRTHDAIVVPQWDGLASDVLQPFVSALKTSARSSQDHGAGRPE
jgi:hypothetical protein